MLTNLILSIFDQALKHHTTLFGISTKPAEGRTLPTGQKDVSQAIQEMEEYSHQELREQDLDGIDDD